MSDLQLSLLNIDETKSLLDHDEDEYSKTSRKFIFHSYWVEVKCLIRIALPMMITNLMNFLILSESVIICGHLGKYEMDGASLANSIVNVGGISIAVGFCTACDTFFSQIYGSKHRKYLGMMMQRSILIGLLAPIVLIALHLNWESLFIVLGQDEKVAINAAQYLTIFCPGFPFVFENLILTRYLQNQYYVMVPMISSICANLLNIGSQYLFIIVLKYGYKASAVCQMFAYVANWSIQLLYIITAKVYKPNWTGWKFDCLLDWGIFFNLAFAGICLIFFEVASWEIGTFATGILGPESLGAQAVLFHYETALFQACFALGVAVSIRVGEALGSNNWKRALMSYRSGLAITFVYGCVCTILFIGLKDYLVLLFSTDPKISSMASDAFPYMIGGLLMDFIGTITMGALKGCGQQKLGILMVLLGFYVLGLPIGMSLTFATSLGIKGIWLGTIVSLFVANSIGFTFTNFIMDWRQQAKLAQERIKNNISRASDNQENFQDSSEYPEPDHNRHQRQISISFTSNPETKGPIKAKMEFITKLERRKIILRRLLTYLIAIIIFLVGLFIKLYLPRSLYLTKNETSHP